MVLVDLSRLYFAVRDLKITIAYEKLFSTLREGRGSPDDEVVALTVADKKNVSQQKFIERIQALGVKVYVYGCETPPNFSTEIAALAALSKETAIVVISNDQMLLRVFGILEEAGKAMTLCFFSEKLDGAWTPKIINKEISFIDLSNPEVKAEILHQ